ncbi:hypothetical protein [Nesterenkonia sp.]|uniref:hypothetical protein n=1 Tax=Nesterenkonia sp. TaxID=704201 RepID=UPI002620A398|nr:hypothetical protein [Nesterenkonia sp.]
MSDPQQPNPQDPGAQGLPQDPQQAHSQTGPPQHYRPPQQPGGAAGYGESQRPAQPSHQPPAGHEPHQHSEAPAPAQPPVRVGPRFGRRALVLVAGGAAAAGLIILLGLGAAFVLDDDSGTPDAQAGSTGEDAAEAEPLSEPLEGEQLSQLILTAEELPQGWEVDAGQVEAMFPEAGDGAEGYEITEEGVGIIGPAGDGYISQNLTMDGFDSSPECEAAVAEFDGSQESVDWMVVSPLAAGDATVNLALASTEEEKDLFGSNYDTVIQECGTSVENLGMRMDFTPIEAIQGFSVVLSQFGQSQHIHMGGQSYQHHHLFIIAEGEVDSAELEEMLTAQRQKLEEGIGW